MEKNTIQSTTQYITNKCQLVRQSSKKIYSQSKHVKINQQNIDQLIEKFHYTPFNQFQHHQTTENQQQSLLYLFVLDSLNFCFWPLQGFQYDQLAGSVKKSILENSLNLEILSTINQQGVKNKIFNGIDVPLVSQRARILRQMSNIVLKQFKGSFITIIKSAKKSAVKLLDTLTKNFLNFQDHSIYKGQQVQFYKRSQILIGDIWAKFQGKGIGQFSDISQLTMFPDYRVPQILNQYKIIDYSEKVSNMIKNKEQIQSGSQIECQIRAASVIAVEKIRQKLALSGKQVNSIQVDWFLWQLGQKNLGKIVNHHRTLTIYY